MGKAISFDLWGTLILSNPYFKTHQSRLAYEFTGIQPHVWLDLKDRIKKITDRQVEENGSHPNRDELYKELLPNCSLKDIEQFIEYSNKLFLKHRPLQAPHAIGVIDVLRQKGFKIYLSSNTVFIHSDTLEKVVFDMFGIISKNCRFSDLASVSKPKEAMFAFPIKPLYHVGDNQITDGGCENFGIEFYHINQNQNLYTFLHYANI